MCERAPKIRRITMVHVHYTSVGKFAHLFSLVEKHTHGKYMYSIHVHACTLYMNVMCASAETLVCYMYCTYIYIYCTGV